MTPAEQIADIDRRYDAGDIGTTGALAELETLATSLAAEVESVKNTSDEWQRTAQRELTKERSRREAAEQFVNVILEELDSDRTIGELLVAATGARDKYEAHPIHSLETVPLPAVPIDDPESRARALYNARGYGGLGGLSWGELSADTRAWFKQKASDAEFEGRLAAVIGKGAERLGALEANIAATGERAAKVLGDSEPLPEAERCPVCRGDHRVMVCSVCGVGMTRELGEALKEPNPSGEGGSGSPGPETAECDGRAARPGPSKVVDRAAVQRAVKMARGLAQKLAGFSELEDSTGYADARELVALLEKL